MSYGDRFDQTKSASRHGTQAYAQASDGTGTTNHLAMFNADGSLTDAGVAIGGSVGGGGSTGGGALGGLFCLVSYVPGGPGTGAIVWAGEVPANITTVQFPANFANSVGKCGASPAATATYTVNVNGTSIGTFSISTAGSFTWATTGGVDQFVAASSDITVTAPNPQDATLADVRFTIYGIR
jgi:hypothetical protein